MKIFPVFAGYLVAALSVFLLIDTNTTLLVIESALFLTMLIVLAWIYVRQSSQTSHQDPEIISFPEQHAPEYNRSNNIVDESALDIIRELQQPGRPDILGKVVRLYLDSTPALIDQICEGFEEGDTERVKQAAHSLKSSSAYLGREGLSESCKLIEFAARENKLSSVANRVSCLKSDYRRVASYLSAYASPCSVI